ncbi:MAG: tyrosine--tRNA ligase [Bdellovibrionales bacterium]|nr:tyrosine--tRNA ligase [Bdellovibrionales bacterium]
MKQLLSKLQARGCVHDASHFDELAKLLDTEHVPFYCGFDPTSDSLHVGSMLPLILMRRLQQAGHRPLVLLGSATGMIGDPSGKSEERVLLDEQRVMENLEGISKQVALFLSKEGPNPYRIVRNDSWLKHLNYIEFLRDIGKHFTINSMIAKDSVRSRLENREQGISYTEFSYMLLQAFDYWWLHQHEGCRLQVGGSDQWGNITAGLELIRRKATTGGAPAYGLTFPLLTTSSGAKFGKTEKGAVWLDAARTSPYHFYQYWLNTADADVIRYAMLFTDIDGEELAALEHAVSQAPAERAAQRYLAAQLTELVHGAEQTKLAISASRVLFGEKLDSLSKEVLLDIFKEVPSVSMTRADVGDGILLTDLLVTAGVAPSKGAARRLVEGGGVYLNNERSNDLQERVTVDRFVDGAVLVIRSGKKNYFLIELSA